MEADTPFYGLFIRISGQTRHDFREAKERLSKALGGVPSNPMILDELLRFYLAGTPAEQPRDAA